MSSTCTLWLNTVSWPHGTTVNLKGLEQILNLGELLLVNDSAQNYLCLLQNEPQGMHWEHKQVTLHPTVAYYTCPNEQCSSTVTHELVHMSEDLKHDAHIV